MPHTRLYNEYGKIDFSRSEWRTLTEAFTDVAKILHPDGEQRAARGLETDDPLCLLASDDIKRISAIECADLAERLRVYLPLAIEMGLVAWHGDRLIKALEYHAESGIPVTFK